MGLTTKIALLLLLQLLGALVGLAAFTSYLGQTEHGEHLVNVAGRQRMLSVQIRAYAGMVSAGEDTDRGGLAELVRTFDSALAALRDGGTVMDGRVPAAPEGTREEILAVAAVWAPLRQRLDVLVEAPRSEVRFAEAARYVEAHAEELRVAADRFVRACELRARRLRGRMLRVLDAVAVLSLLLLVAGVLLTRRYVVGPVRRLEEAARAVGAGDFSKRLDLSTRDELSTLARCFNQMSSRLQQTLADLDRQRRRAQQVVSSVPSGLMLLRRDMAVLSANRAMCAMLGATPAEVLGRSVTELLPVPGLRDLIEEVAGNPDAVRELAGTLERTGHPPRSLRVAAAGTRDAEEEEEEAPVLLVVDDLSEEERLRARARDSELRFREVVENATDGIVMMDREGVIRYFNRAAEQIFGHARDVVLGRPVTILMPEAFRAAHRDGLRRYLSSGESRVLGRVKSLDGLRAGGSVFPIELTVTATEVAGEPLFTGVLRDVTERQQLTARMMQMDRMVAVGTLAAGVGHEINNPLTYVIANVGFALQRIGELAPGDGEPSEALAEVCEVLREAEEGAGRIRDIVRDLRTFSRGDDERVGEVDVRKVLESSINMGFNEIRHRARLVRDFADTPPVRGNESRLGQVFLNLLVNAAHAIPEGAADANQVRVRSYVAGDGRVAVEVADTGAGIAPEHLPRIFDPFFTTKPVGQGTGLGLSICRRIVGAHGGELRVESVVGEGSTFRVLLPAVPVERPAVPRSAPEPAGSGGEAGSDPPRRSAGRIMIVDDAVPVGRVVRRALGDEYEVVVVTRARDALARIEAGERFGVILCDLMMPEMTGMDLHARLAETIPGMAERMVFLTGGAFTPRARAFLGRVENPRLDKPFSPESLRALVREILERGTGPDPQCTRPEVV